MLCYFVHFRVNKVQTLYYLMEYGKSNALLHAIEWTVHGCDMCFAHDKLFVTWETIYYMATYLLSEKLCVIWQTICNITYDLLHWKLFITWQTIWPLEYIYFINVLQFKVIEHA